VKERKREIMIDQCRFPWQQPQQEMDRWMDRYKIMDGGGMDVHQFNSCLMIFDDVVAV
jgi:hypothetical protein